MSNLLMEVLKKDKYSDASKSNSQLQSIRQLSVEALKAIASYKHKDDALNKATANLATIVNKPSALTIDNDKNPDSSEVSETPTNERYKTELCRKFMENSSCPYGRKCQFSHGFHELKPVSRHPRYRTELCREFFNTGLCTYGTRCNFIHHGLSNSNTLHQTDHAAGLKGLMETQQCMEASERPFTPNNDSGFSFGSSNPSLSSTPSSLDAYSPIESTRISERSDSPNELYSIPEEVLKR